jgi:hypothetical protein
VVRPPRRPAGERDDGTEIARLVAAELAIGPLVWEAQAVTLSYERARRGREVGARPDGFAISGPRTVAVPVEQLFDAGRRVATGRLAGG